MVSLVDEWVCEIQSEFETQNRLESQNEFVIQNICEESLGPENEFENEGAWDDVHGGELPVDLVRSARKEEVDYMQNERRIWSLRPVKECWDKTGKAPVSVRWVDTNKGGKENFDIRWRLVARDFKGEDKGRDDLYASTTPLEGKRMLVSKAAARCKRGRFRSCRSLMLAKRT